MEGPHRCRRAPGVASVVRRDARTGNARAGNRRGVFTCSSTRTYETRVGGDAIDILARDDHRSRLITAKKTQHPACAADIVVVVVEVEDASNRRSYIHSVMQARTIRRGTGIHQDVVPEISSVCTDCAIQGIREVGGTRNQATGNVHRVEVDAIVVRCGWTGLVDPEDIRLRIAPQTNDVVAVGGGAGSDLDAVEVCRGA